MHLLYLISQVRLFAELLWLVELLNLQTFFKLSKKNSKKILRKNFEKFFSNFF
jgi:phage terminase large subunit